jgi:hypothetical protein
MRSDNVFTDPIGGDSNTFGHRAIRIKSTRKQNEQQFCTTHPSE